MLVYIKWDFLWIIALMTMRCAFTQHDRRVHLVQAHLVHFFNPPCCRPDSCGCDSHVTCAVAKMRRDYSFVSDVETLDVKRQLYGWIQLILVYLLNPLSVSPCAIIEHRAWFALIEPKMSVIKLIRLFDTSIPSAGAHCGTNLKLCSLTSVCWRTVALMDNYVACCI